MAIREDLVASATQFLQDPSVASSSVENRITFLKSKNLTQEEIDAALARTGAVQPSGPPGPYGGAHNVPQQQYYQQYPPYAWQPQPQQPKRDWRDWFIMATVVSGVGYGLYTLGKRYVYPLVAPPTPERLEQDKKSIEEQFDKAFGLVEQLAKDTDELKKAEQLRTEKLDTTLTELETVMGDLKTANRRRDDDAQRIREEIQALKDAIPKAMESQKTVTDNRLFEINSELGSLKTLISQRMGSGTSASAVSPVSTFQKPSNNIDTNSSTAPTATSSTPATTDPEKETEAPKATVSEAPKSLSQGSFNKTSSGKASIPAWQMAMASKNSATGASSASTNGASEGASSSS